ncbi:MAG: hypothetical protein CL843_19400 [Crocinitomicaceae bacterium]|nr:hypothetical protein [Crocinitomicaceae bacterium]|tara:strand:+ start:19498 stop:20115 length:618 start_codon:yes stop_codon:yes gene_type:complete
MASINVTFSNAAMGKSPKVMHKIHAENKNIGIYKRDISHLQPEVKQCLDNNIEFHQSGSIQEIELALKKQLNTYTPLIDDVMMLLQLFREVSQSKSFKVLLANVNTNMCRRFHTDTNDLRLLCTYFGPGTIWLPEGGVNKEALKAYRGNSHIVTNTSLIQQANTGDVLLLKGSLYHHDEARAVVHRSPTIEESGKKRLLLRIDTN